MLRKTICCGVILFALAAGYSDRSQPDAGTPRGAASSDTSPGTGAGAEAGAPYAGKGPHVAGVTRLRLDDGRQVVVWYPAQRGATTGAQEVVVLPSLLTQELQAKIPAEQRVPYKVDAYEGAAPDRASGPYPVVLFSHGFAGYPEQSTNLTTHLAQWGFVVVAPEHVERSLGGLLGDHSQGVAKSDDPTVLARSLDLVVAENSHEGSALRGMVDKDEVAVTGHSAGAGAAYRLASSDSRIKAFISYSVGFGGQGGAAPAPPPKPGMVMLGTTDGVIPPDSSRQLWDTMAKPKYRVEIAGAGHLVFSDICEIGKAQGGIVAIVKRLNLPIPDNLLKLGSDGCDPGSLDPTKAFGSINHLSVAFLRFELGLDQQPRGLSTKAVAGLGAPVTVTAAS